MLLVRIVLPGPSRRAPVSQLRRGLSPTLPPPALTEELHVAQPLALFMLVSLRIQFRLDVAKVPGVDFFLECTSGVYLTPLYIHCLLKCDGVCIYYI